MGLRAGTRPRNDSVCPHAEPHLSVAANRASREEEPLTFFESLLVLLLLAIALLQIARLLSLPYPAMLAAAGVGVAFIPGVPVIHVDPTTALALFIAPALLDAAYDFPPGAAKRFWEPLLALAVLAVLVTSGVVAWLAVEMLGLPIAAAVALGAIVAPPDAAAAVAVLSTAAIPKTTNAVLKGESLFNDATALLLFSAALQIQSHGSLTWSIGARLGLAAPGGILLGIAFGMLLRKVTPLVRDTLGGNLLQFCSTYLVWVVAEHLKLSAVLCVVAYGMTVARNNEIIHSFTRMRVQSYAVWSAVVFALNVFAFLIMGMQVRSIAGKMHAAELLHALRFCGAIIAAVIVTRLLIVVGFNRFSAWRQRRKGNEPPATLQQGLLAGWSGMRGFVTLATAFALPAGFPQRDTLVLAAFSVVLGTLVLQGMTLKPLIGWLGLDRRESVEQEMAEARVSLAKVALATLEGHSEREAEHLRFLYALDRHSSEQPCSFDRYRKLGLIGIRAERRALEKMRVGIELDPDLYLRLQEELDWRELTLLPDEARQIEEI